MIIQFFILISFLSLVQTYVFYPLTLQIMSRFVKNQLLFFDFNDKDLPSVTICLAVFNEEKVIHEKIKSTFLTNYPLDKIEFLIGSDSSTDSTNKIIESYKQIYPQIKFKIFEKRTGKSEIVNDLVKMALHDFLIMTDANVFFDKDTIYQLTKNFKNEEVSFVGGNIINSITKRDGISLQEKSYLSHETKLKFNEGLIWGKAMGVFGGLYSIRKNCYTNVPKSFVVDDFYISLNALLTNKKGIIELSATAQEDVSNKIKEEFRRKSRIGKGNFQNLVNFSPILLKPFSSLAFCFFNHKVLRWLGPYFILTIFIGSTMLFSEHSSYKILFFTQLVMLLLPLVDVSLKKVNLNIKILRFISHFYLMNLALMVGLFKYIYDHKSSGIWTPTERNQ